MGPGILADHLRRLLGLARTQPELRVDVSLGHLAVELVHRRPGRAGRDVRDHARLLQDPGHSACPGAVFHGRGGSTGRAQGCSAEHRSVGSGLREGPGGSRPEPAPGWHVFYRDWDSAAGGRVPPGCRFVAALGLGPSGEPRYPEPDGSGSAERGYDGHAGQRRTDPRSQGHDRGGLGRGRHGAGRHAPAGENARPVSAGAGPAPGRGRLRPADRLLQRGEPHAGSGDAAGTGDCLVPGPRRDAETDRRPGADGKRGALGGRRGPGSSIGAVGTGSADSPLRATCPCAPLVDVSAGLALGAFLLSGDRCHDGSVGNDPCPAGHWPAGPSRRAADVGRAAPAPGADAEHSAASWSARWPWR